MIGLGCMRLSTVPPRDPARGIAVIHAALDAGALLLDTADAYGLDENDTGHNERLVAAALKSWSGDRTRIEVATKGGIRRPGGLWVPDGRAKHLRAACEASRRALEVDTIDLYQLHVVDPRTPLDTSVRALAALQREGKIRRVGLSNVTVGQIEAARRIVEISSVQVSLSILDDENLRNGVTAYCRDHDLRLIAYRPLGGRRTDRLTRDPVLAEIAARHGATAQEIALAWLLDLDSDVVPIPGATRAATARSIARVLALRLTDQDREQLDERLPAGRLLRTRDAVPKAPARADGEVVLVMGMPAAGKSTVAQEYVARGYERLNRDQVGGTLTDLASELAAGLGAGRRRWVLDNTYASRKSRNQVIDCATQQGVPVRCVYLTTGIADAQINAVSRLLAAHGRLPTPEELRSLGKSDHRYFGPDAQFRYERQVEPPVADEGFSSIEARAFTRRTNPDFTGRAILLEFDGVLCSSASGGVAVLEPNDLVIPADRRETLARYHADGWTLLATAWRPQIAEGKTPKALVDACSERARELLELEIDIAYCPHPAGPPICWCRKPLPGLVLEFGLRHRLALDRCLLVGRAAADRTLAARLGMQYHDVASFFKSAVTAVDETER